MPRRMSRHAPAWAAFGPPLAMASGMTPATLFDPAALGIVLGGTLLATALRTPLRDVAHALLALRIVPRPRESDAPEKKPKAGTSF